jgi:hypothetical protein
MFAEVRISLYEIFYTFASDQKIMGKFSTNSLNICYKSYFNPKLLTYNN